jgi:hypothetical protein
VNLCGLQQKISWISNLFHVKQLRCSQWSKISVMVNRPEPWHFSRPSQRPAPPMCDIGESRRLWYPPGQPFRCKENQVSRGNFIQVQS